MMAKRLLLLLGLWMMGMGRTFAQPQTDVGSFMHRLTIQRDTACTEITQWVAPVSVQLPFAGGKFEVRTAGMFLRQTGGNSQSAVGVLDTEMIGRWSFGQNVLMDVHAALPTGKSALDPQDDALVRTIARNDLGFPVKAFGQGMKLGATLSVVRHSGNWTTSVGSGIVYRRAYEPVAGIANYKPGEEIAASIGVDYTYGPWVIRMGATGIFHRTDRQNGVAVFRNGKQMTFQLGALYAGRAVRLKVEILEIARLKNMDLSNGTFLYETRDSNGNDLRARAEMSWTITRFVTLFGAGRFKHLTHNAYAPGSPLYQGDAHLLEGGGGLALSFGPNHHLSLRFSRLTGRAEDDAADLSARSVHGKLSVVF